MERAEPFYKKFDSETNPSELREHCGGAKLYYHFFVPRRIKLFVDLTSNQKHEYFARRKQINRNLKGR
jgi:hypothetical protein